MIKSNYLSSVTQLQRALHDAYQVFGVTEYTYLAAALIAGGQYLDQKKARVLDVNFRCKGIVRSADSPPDYTHEDVLDQPGADDIKQPLDKGESWNAGRRATLTGIPYDLDDNGHPLNPYGNTGLCGRGCLYQFGPNHAVDNGVIVIQPGEDGSPALYALGILRKYDNDAPAFSGGFAKFTRSPDGNYQFDNETLIDSAVEEFFEEMISGSIELLPEYVEKLEKEYFGEEEKAQAETALKLQQVRDLDPGFLNRLRGVMAGAHECFAGAVLNDNRNTNNAWIESRLSWFRLDDDVWEKIKGNEPKFNYRFMAGDDASGTVLHRIDSKLIQTAYASHGPMFAFMTASFLLEAQKNGEVLAPSILQQIKDVTTYLSNIQASVKLGSAYVPK